MKRVCRMLVLVSMFLFCLAPLHGMATTLLIVQENPLLGYGYGLYGWDNMTSALQSSFGAANITVSNSPLDNYSYLSSFDRLWITAGSPGDALSSTEINNLAAFIGTGKRVVLIGENSSWTAWNNSILQPVGGSYGGSDTSDTLAPLVTNELTAGVTSLNTIADGLAVGGTSLFNQNVATLWDGNGTQNVFSLLSVNVIDDDYGAGAYNMQFKSNIAGWLVGTGATAVPEPFTLLLLGVGLIGLAGYGRKKLN